MHTTKSQVKMELQAQLVLESNSISRPVRTTEVGLTKTDAQTTYGLRFERSTYRWKANVISFPTQLVSHHFDFRDDRKSRRNVMDKICQGAATPVFVPAGLVRPRVARPPPWPPPTSLFYIHSRRH